jgi:hypothetical protein
LSAFTPWSAARRTASAAAHREQAFGRRPAIFGDVFVDAIAEADDVRAGIVHEHGAANAVGVHAPQQVGRALHDLLQLVEVAASPRDHLQHVGLHVPPGLDVDVGVGHGHGGPG